MLLKSGQKMVLIGDSITDAGRREDQGHLGQGYVRLFRDLLWVRHPGLDVQLVNKGIGGDTVRHLERRWHEDVISEKPDVLSISIGVNDVWRQLDGAGEPVYLDDYEAVYRSLLERTRKEVHCRLVLCEPTIIGERIDDPGNVKLEDYCAVVHRLADEFDALLVAMNRAFWHAIESRPDCPWTADGVHPLSNGHLLMAWTLLGALESVE